MAKTKQDSTVVTRRGEVSKRRVDSLKKANPALGRVIGSGTQKPGQKVRYGDASSDAIKAGLKPKKKS